MKRALFSAALALGFTGVAGAADLAVRAPVIAPLPVFSWTGIYLGIGGGTGWGNKEYSWNQDATLAAIAAQMPTPDPPRLARPRIAPDQWRIFRGPTRRKLADRVGRFWNPGRRSLGDIEGHGSCFDGGAVATAGISFACNDKVTSFGTVTGRVGAAVDRALIYAKGGWAWEHGQHSLNPTAPFNVMGGNDPLASITAASSSQSRTGWTFGAGVEYAFAQNGPPSSSTITSILAPRAQTPPIC